MNLETKYNQPQSNISIINNISGDSFVIYTAFRIKTVAVGQNTVTLMVESPAQPTGEVYI
jgi:hypothetical protein